MRSKIYLEQFLDQTAKRGTWYGGGSAAALACALAAALLEKLVSRSNATGSIRAIRSRCTQLIHQDARAFASVIRAKVQNKQPTFRRALKAAIEIPSEVCVCSQRLLRTARKIGQTMSPRYQVDLRCAMALAKASRDAALALVATNLAWLGDQTYSLRIRKKLARINFASRNLSK